MIINYYLLLFYMKKALLKNLKNDNVGFKSINNCNMVLFNTTRKIKKGEELLINYDEF